MSVDTVVANQVYFFFERIFEVKFEQYKGHAHFFRGFYEYVYITLIVKVSPGIRSEKRRFGDPIFP